MNLKQFRALDINEQAIAVWTGTFLDTLAEAKFNVHLYNVANFYVEVYYSNNLNEIVKMKAFVRTSLIQQYLNKIDIKAVVNW